MGKLHKLLNWLRERAIVIPDGFVRILAWRGISWEKDYRTDKKAALFRACRLAGKRYNRTGRRESKKQ